MISNIFFGVNLAQAKKVLRGPLPVASLCTLLAGGVNSLTPKLQGQTVEWALPPTLATCSYIAENPLAQKKIQPGIAIPLCDIVHQCPAATGLHTFTFHYRNGHGASLHKRIKRTDDHYSSTGYRGLYLTVTGHG